VASKTSRFTPNQITALRVLHGLTKEAFGQKVGYTGAYIGQLERGIANPSVKFLNKVAEVFRVDLRSFFSGNES